MKSSSRLYRDLEALHNEFSERKNAIRARLQDFAAIPDDQVFYELAYCLLTPQSRALHADRVVGALKESGFREIGGDPTPLLRRKEQYIRFHNTKAVRLLTMRRMFPAVLQEVQQSRCAAEGLRKDAPRLRAWLVDQVPGLGWKEASHFLRNIGYRDLAILDRHILRNLHSHGVLRAVPRTLTPKRYTIIEQRFLVFAATVDITMDELDLLFWSRETGEIRK